MALKSLPETPFLPAAKADSLGAVKAWQTSMVQAVWRNFKDIAYRVNRVLPKDGSEVMTNPLPLAIFTVATRPAASAWKGAIIFVSDAAAGDEFQGSNGTAWVALRGTM